VRVTKENDMAGSREVYEPGSGESGIYADEVHVTKHRTHSRLLGPDGNRLPYSNPQTVGFRLTKSASQINKGAKCL